MADQEVKIVVTQEMRGHAVAEANAELERLKKEGGKTGPNTYAQVLEQQALDKRSAKDYAGAAAAEKELRVHEATRRIKRDIGVSDQEAVRMAERRVNAEDAIRKGGGHGGNSNATVVGDFLDRVTGHSGWVRRLSMLQHSGGGEGGEPSMVSKGLGMAASFLTGPVGMAALAGVAAAATVYKVASTFAKQRDEEETIAIQGRVDQRTQDRQMSRLAGFEGSSGSARKIAEDLRDDLAQAKDEEELIKKRSEWKWYDHPIDRLMNKLTGADENELRKQRQREVRDVQGIASAEAAKQKHWEEIGSKEMEARKARLNYDPRRARDLEHQVARQQEYERVMGELGRGHEKEANEAGDLKVKELERDEWAKVGARLVNARSGAGDIARAARVATGEIGGGTGAVVAELAGFRRDANRNHQEAVHPHRV